MTKITIAIDGFSSCGKSTLAKALASKLGYAYVDSGAMYRCVTLYALRKGVIKDHSFQESDVVKLLNDINLSFHFNPNTKSSETYLNGENVEKEIRQMVVSENVSKVSAIHDVRVKMIAIQRELGKNKGIVMDGRDIGTNVFPYAELKLFMTADTDIRTQRRFDEYSSKGQHISFSDVKLNLIHRDHEDTHRSENPLIQAEDAIVLDNSELTREQQLEFVIKLISDLTLT
ncbi:MAG: (d)CMP kinase, partial [Bacteroidetes bacterium]|nr:(d)CMP kinase [Bacteroidota bacterium]